MPQLPPNLAALLEVARRLARASSSARLLEGLPVRPLTGKELERALRDAWDEAPSKVLDDLDPEPLRLTATSQVHRAQLDGRDVAVEVQSPGLAGAVRGDLALLDALSPPMALAFPKIRAGALLREARERVLDELDLEHGASVQRALRRALRGDERVVVPEPFGALTTEAVAVEGWLGGQEAGAGQAEVLLDVSLRLAAREGWILVDHRPEHVRLLDDGRIGLLATRSAVRLDKARVGLFGDALRGLREDDAAPLAALGVVDDPEKAHAVARAALGPLVDGPARLDWQALQKAGERAIDAGGFALAGAVTPQPTDLWPGRGLGQLAFTLAAWGAQADWGALAVEALTDG